MEVYNPHIAEYILRAINRNKDGIQVDKLEEGTRLFVFTRNSMYEMVILGNATGRQISMEISGGTLQDGDTRYENPVPGFFVGSTFGSSMLKINWLGKDMCMEFSHENKVLTTSSVKNVEIEAPDGSWSYSLGWNNEDQN